MKEIDGLGTKEKEPRMIMVDAVEVGARTTVPVENVGGRLPRGTVKDTSRVLGMTITTLEEDIHQEGHTTPPDPLHRIHTRSTTLRP